MVKLLMLLCLLFCTGCNANWWLFFGGDSGWSGTFTNTYSASLDGTGSNETVEFGDLDALDYNYTDSFSICFWAKLGAINTNKTPIGKFSGSGWSITTWTGGLNAARLKFWFEDTDGDYFVVEHGAVYSNGAWQHYCFTYDGTGVSGVTGYLGGSPSTGGNVTSGTVDKTSANSGSFQIGDGFLAPAVGVYGDVVITDKEFSAAEISEIYNSGSEYDMQNFSDWATFNASSGSFWITFEDSDMTGGSGTVPCWTTVCQNTPGTPTNTESGDKVSDAP